MCFFDGHFLCGLNNIAKDWQTGVLGSEILLFRRGIFSYDVTTILCVIERLFHVDNFSNYEGRQ